MKPTFLASAILLALPLGALAADPPPPPQGWSGSGEAGLAVASGNTKSQNVNVKLDLKFNDDRWKDDFYVLALRNKANATSTSLDNSTNPPTLVSTTRYQTTADRWEGGPRPATSSTSAATSSARCATSTTSSRRTIISTSPRSVTATRC